MLNLIAAAVQVVRIQPIPRVPPPPPPFTRKVEAEAHRISARAYAEFKRCGDARTNSNGRSVEAFRSPRFSPEWKKATVAMENALTVCQGLRLALRNQEDFLIGVVQNGTRHDAELAVPQLGNVSSELEGLEQYFASEARRYRQLLTVGWGDPHCAARADGFMPPSSICPPDRPGSQR